MPFYVAPEQVMKDRSDYARKGIARGKPVVILEYADGILFIADNPSTHLYKISEIYDRIAFAAVGKYSEFENLRIAGVRLADLRGYSYGREDVTAKSIANAYSQGLAEIFTQQMKPYEVELLVGQVGERPEENELFHILYDGSVTDEDGVVAMGGQSQTLGDRLQEGYSSGMVLGDAVRLGVTSLTSENGQEQVEPGRLEIAVLERTRPRRKFRRLSDPEVADLLGT
ncbi:MAG TPA: proteasome subunit alpha [Actinomycetota bacterium]|jgi:proteasome alpha subunit|nr:proteasome subunit alpha [Actinomycetota bacterium]